MSASAASCPKGATLNFVAHQDDDLLFQNPKLLQEARSGVCMRTVYVLAGDAGDSDSYWQNREFGARAAYAETMSVADQWTKTDAGIAGHPIPLWTLNGAPHVSLAFMRLPDGNIDGSGFPTNGHESLQKLYAGTMDRIYPVDGTASYTLDGVLGTLLAFMTSFQPNSVNTLDYTATYGSGLDHSDHMTVAYLAIMAQREYTTPHGFAGYQGYGHAEPTCERLRVRLHPAKRTPSSPTPSGITASARRSTNATSDPRVPGSSACTRSARPRRCPRCRPRRPRRLRRRP